ncbi:MAG: hypothetical protein ILP12_00735 [Lachnospiraceae bacterium]|nr:hypothetical protein [Lachnospiraceae bacterium]
MRLYRILTAVFLAVFLCMAASCSFRPFDPSTEPEPTLSREQAWIESIHQKFGTNYTILAVTQGDESTYPIEMAAIARDEEKNTEGTLFVLVAPRQTMPAREKVTYTAALGDGSPTVYLSEEPIHLDGNNIVFAFKTLYQDGREEITDVRMAVLWYAPPGAEDATGIMFRNNSSIRSQP